MPEMRGNFEVHTLPNGSEVYYRDSDHSYFSAIEERPGGKWVGPKEKRLPSPSTVGKILDTNPEGLLRWAAKQTCAGVVKLDHVPDDPDDLWGVLCGRKLTYRDLRDQRATEGTNVHEKVLACLAAGERIPSLADVTGEERGYGQGVFAAWHDLDPSPIATEVVVASRVHGFAGRVDLICEVDGQRMILDLKTGWVGNGAHTQLAGYRLAADESGYGPIDRAAILKVDADGSYAVMECAAANADFIAALSAYRSASEVGKRSRELLKAAA